MDKNIYKIAAELVRAQQADDSEDSRKYIEGLILGEYGIGLHTFRRLISDLLILISEIKIIKQNDNYTEQVKDRLKSLDFHFISDVQECDGIYLKKYAKDIYDGKSKIELLSSGVAFRSEYDVDCRTVIRYENILMEQNLTRQLRKQK